MNDSTNGNNADNLPLIIVNPTSASGSTGAIWASKASDFATHFGAFKVEFTRKSGDGKRLALEAAQNGRKFIIACGGDGTINEVANGILESGNLDCELGILPSGTGGDFRRTFDIPAFTPKAADYLKNGTTKKIDVGKAIFFDETGAEMSRYFLGIASFGLSTTVISRLKKDKPFNWLPLRAVAGRAGFAWSTLLSTLEMQHTDAKIQIDDGRERYLKLVNLCVANARYFGGGMKIAPEAKLDDGLFDVVMIGEISGAKILANSYKLYNGTHLSVEDVHHTHARKIKVSPAGNKKIRLELDGELPGFLPLTVEVVPQVLKLRVPKK